MNDATNLSQNAQARIDLRDSLLEVQAAAEDVLKSISLQSTDFPTPSHVEVVVAVLTRIYKANLDLVLIGLGGNPDPEKALVARICHELDGLKGRIGNLDPDK